ncbi:hypothetical protein [Escherichia phage REP3]|nr:hypothetical protein [Escherichia phage REP2]WCA46116.1 hypothetical protein [Escherichia phage REP3]
MNIKRMLFKQGLYTLNVTPKGDTTKWSVNDGLNLLMKTVTGKFK